jgi:hypothetical protein
MSERNWNSLQERTSIWIEQLQPFKQPKLPQRTSLDFDTGNHRYLPLGVDFEGEVPDSRESLQVHVHGVARNGILKTSVQPTTAPATNVENWVTGDKSARDKQEPARMAATEPNQHPQDEDEDNSEAGVGHKGEPRMQPRSPFRWSRRRKSSRIS